MSPKRTLRGVATTLAIAMIALAATTTTALAGPSAQRQDPVTIQADPPPATNPTIARANQIMGLDYRAFDRLPKNEPPFDWSTNGCSTPWPQGAPIIGDFDDDFRRACDQHDFGYANYGAGGLELSRTGETRAWIDERLLQEMRRTCNNDVPLLDIPICHTVAAAFYGAVRTFGGIAYFN